MAKGNSQQIRKRKRPIIGDVLEIETPKGFAYLQYSHEDPFYGSLIRVLQGVYPSRLDSLAAVVREKEAYFTFYPVQMYVSDGLAHIVAHEPVPEFAAEQPVMRATGAIDRQGHILGWWILEGGSERRVHKLTPEQKKLSLAQNWSHGLLVEHIVSGWTPLDEAETYEGEPDFGQMPTGEARTGDSQALQELLKVDSAPTEPRQFRHYLYFPKRENARRAAAELKKDGFSVEIERSADEKSWQCLAIHTLVTTDDSIEELRDKLEALAEHFGGEYDGWEAEVRSS